MEKSFGKTIVIDHGNDYSTVYSHIGEIFVQQGDPVSRGQRIARVENLSRDHVTALHFEIRKSQKPENPFYYLPE